MDQPGHNEAPQTKKDDSASPEATQPAATDQTHETKPDKLNGIKGWLFLLVLGLGISVLVYLFAAAQDFSTYNQTAPYFGAYPGMQALLGFELLANLALSVFALYVFYLMIKRKRKAKTMTIVYIAGMIAVSLIDWGWAVSVFQNNAAILKEVQDPSDFIRTALYAFIWIPYLRTSKRVARTLTEE